MKTLRVNDITVQYGQKTIFNRFNLTVNREDLLVILGPSGCGKSTLLYAIAGLVKPADGSIVFDQETVFSAREGINLPAERRNIGFVFQDYSLWPHMSVFNNIAYPLRVQGMKTTAVKHRVNRLLDGVGLSDKRDSIPSRLSGGEKQRVAIARAIAAEPALLLLDEPLANIDAALKTQLLALIVRLKKELDIPAVYVTHDQKEAFEIANRMVVMNAGQVMQEGCPRFIYRHPANEFVAGFVGENNLVARSVFNAEEQHGNPNDLAAIRPEDIYISPKGQYRGQIRRIVYKGNYSSLYVKMCQTEMMIHTTDSHFREGDFVRFAIRRMHALPRK